MRATGYGAHSRDVDPSHLGFIYKTKRRKGSRTVIIGGKRHREQHRIPGKFIYKTKRRKGSRTVIIGGKRHREQHRIPGKFGLGLH
ncbi:hypothetical protein SRHO_G00343560 [Serrasalmus rhombeus]